LDFGQRQTTGIFVPIDKKVSCALKAVLR